MKKLINKYSTKIMAAMLSLAMVLTGVFSFGTIKKETASADQIEVYGGLLEEPQAYSFAYNMVLDMRFYPQESCMIIDSAFLLDSSISNVMSYRYDNTAGIVAFLQGFADGLRERSLPDEPGVNPEDYTLDDLLEMVQMNLFVHEHGTSYYYDLQTGDRSLHEINSKRALMDFTRMDIEHNPYYATIVYPYSHDYYHVLYSLQTQEPFAVYMFATEPVTLSGTGLMMCWQEGLEFTPACEWEN